MSGDEMKWLWERILTQDYAFDDFSRGKWEWFCYMLADPRYKFFKIGDSGLFLVENPEEGKTCGIHFVVWDRNYSLQRDKSAPIELLDWLFYNVKVHRVQGNIPIYNKLAPRFVLSMGFKYEGELREAVLWKQQYHAVAIYGLLERDWAAWKGRIKLQ
jgi:RimJ/RimL family protein N-acetyltransferase